MCDESKLADWARQTISRRQFGALTGAAALTACASGGSESMGQNAAPGLKERGINFATADGRLDGGNFLGGGMSLDEVEENVRTNGSILTDGTAQISALTYVDPQRFDGDEVSSLDGPDDQLRDAVANLDDE